MGPGHKAQDDICFGASFGGHPVEWSVSLCHSLLLAEFCDDRAELQSTFEFVAVVDSRAAGPDLQGFKQRDGADGVGDFLLR